MPRRVLITGITGFAGSHLAEAAVTAGLEVHGLAHEDPPFAHMSAIADRVRMHRGDISDPAAVGAVVAAARPDTVFHLAAQAVPSAAAADPPAALRVNVLGTATVVGALRAQGDASLVFASSAEVYDPAARVPYREESPVRAQNVYAATKIAAEAIVRELGDGGAASATILRPSNQLGPRLHPELAASAFARQIALIEAGRAEPVLRHGRLDSRRDFVDVRDMARAYLKAGELRGDRTETYNVGTMAPVSIGEVLEMLLGMSRVPIQTEPDPARVRDGDPSVISVDSAAFRERTGWRPEIPLERSLADALNYWRDEVSRARSAGEGAPAERSETSLERRN